MQFANVLSTFTSHVPLSSQFLVNQMQDPKVDILDGLEVVLNLTPPHSLE